MGRFSPVDLSFVCNPKGYVDPIDHSLLMSFLKYMFGVKAPCFCSKNHLVSSLGFVNLNCSSVATIVFFQSISLTSHVIYASVYLMLTIIQFTYIDI